MPAYLLVDDDVGFCERLAGNFRKQGFTDVRTAYSYEDALIEIRDRRVDRGVIDMRLDGDKNGFDVVQALREQWPESRALMLTAYASIDAAWIAYETGACAMLPKTDDVAAILHGFARPDRKWRDTSKIAYRPPTLEELKWQHFCHVLEYCDGDMSKTAQILDVNRSTLYRLLNRTPVAKWTRSAHLAMELRADESAEPKGRRPKGRRPRKPGK